LAAGSATGPSASLWRPGSAAARSFLPQPVKRAAKLVAEHGVGAFNAVGATDHHMIRSGEALGRDDLAGEGTEPALHAVADDRSADFLGDGESHAHRRIRIPAIADEQDKSRSRDTTAAIRGKEVGALLDRG
jgi:hypothetical protein